MPTCKHGVPSFVSPPCERCEAENTTSDHEVITRVVQRMPSAEESISRMVAIRRRSIMEGLRAMVEDDEISETATVREVIEKLQTEVE